MNLYSDEGINFASVDISTDFVQLEMVNSSMYTKFLPQAHTNIPMP